MSQTFMFDESGEPAQTLVIQPATPKAQDGAGAVNRCQVYRDTKPIHTGQRLRVLKHVERMATTGATRDEIAEALRMPVSSVCGRVDELIEGPWADLVETDQKRPTRYGRPAVVLVAKSVLSDKP